MSLVVAGIILVLVFIGGALLGFLNLYQVNELRSEVEGLKRDLAAALRDGAVATNRTSPTEDHDTANASPETQAEPAKPTPPRASDAAERPTMPGGFSGSSADKAPPPIPKVPPLAAGATPAPPSDSGMAFEDRLGSQWIVWVGGVALALGAIFLVKYSIDAGLIGPGMRIVLGALLATVLAGLGEYARRTDIVDQLKDRAPDQLGGLSNAYVPGVLTAAALVAAFATVYAAYALYGFVAGPIAFGMLALVSFAGLAASVLHGPGIAALGLVGGYVTPALVSTNAPSAWSLFTYLLVLTGAVYLTAWMRGWLNLARFGCGASIAWASLWLLTTYKSGDALPLGLFIIGLAILAIVFLRDEARDMETSEPASGFDVPLIQILAATGALAAFYVLVQGHGSHSVQVVAAMMAILLVSADRWRSLLPLAIVASGLFGLFLMTWPNFAFWSVLDGNPYKAVGGGGPSRLITMALLGGGALAGLGLFQTFTRRPHVIWGGIAALVPVLTFAYVYLRVTHFTASLAFAMAGLVITAVYVVLAERLDRIDEYSDVAEPDRAWTVGALAAAACAFLALTMTIYFEKGWLTIGLAAMAPALAWISIKRPIPILRWVTAIVAAVVIGRLLWDPRIVGEALGTTPVFNWLLYGYGLPTLAFAAAARFLLRDGDDLPAKIVRGVAIGFGVTLVGMEVRHLMNNGNVFSNRFDLGELAIHTLTWLALSLGLRWRAGETRDGLMMQAANLVGLAGFASIAFGHLLGLNPMFTHDPVGGGLLLNDLLLAYALPAILCGLIIWQLMGTGDDSVEPASAYLRSAFRNTAGALGLLLAFAYLTLQVSRVFQGPLLRLDPSDGELYTWSAVWIGFAICLLGAGIRVPSRQLRQAGFAVLLVSTLKIFLIDMAALTGLLRALSFIGLGGVLVGLGYAYQRLMMRSGRSGPTPDATFETSEP